MRASKPHPQGDPLMLVLKNACSQVKCYPFCSPDQWRLENLTGNRQNPLARSLQRSRDLTQAARAHQKGKENLRVQVAPASHMSCLRLVMSRLPHLRVTGCALDTISNVALIQSTNRSVSVVCIFAASKAVISRILPWTTGKSDSLWQVMKLAHPRPKGPWMTVLGTRPFQNFCMNLTIFQDTLPANMEGTKPCIFLELCAGSAKLSAAVRSTGISVVPIDRKHNRHAPRCRLVQLDLAQPHAWNQILFLLDNYTVVACHIAPPCGTCSRARGIPMADGSPGPQPLRSDSEPMGIKGLSYVDQMRVDGANALYDVLGNWWKSCTNEIYLGQLKIPLTL